MAGTAAKGRVGILKTRLQLLRKEQEKLILQVNETWAELMEAIDREREYKPTKKDKR